MLKGKGRPVCCCPHKWRWNEDDVAYLDILQELQQQQQQQRRRRHTSNDSNVDANGGWNVGLYVWSSRLLDLLYYPICGFLWRKSNILRWGKYGFGIHPTKATRPCVCNCKIWGIVKPEELPRLRYCSQTVYPPTKSYLSFTLPPLMGDTQASVLPHCLQKINPQLFLFTSHKFSVKVVEI